MFCSMKNSSCQWFLEPIPGGLNNSIASLLGSDVSANEQNDMRCADGKPHNLWEVRVDIVKRAFGSFQPYKDFYVWRSRNRLPAEDVTRVARIMFSGKVKKPKLSNKPALLAKYRKHLK